jgi:hypothetical protein
MGLDRISAGDDVVTADGATLGTVAAVHNAYLLVEKGLLVLTSYHVPLNAIERHDSDDGTVYLTKTSDEILASGWEQEGDDAEAGAVPTLLTGAASTPDSGEVLAVLDADDEPLREQEAEID